MMMIKKAFFATGFLPVLFCSFIFSLPVLQDTRASAVARAESVAQQNASLTSGSATVPFIKNNGQISDERVMFYARTFGGTVFVTREGEMVYSLLKFGERDSSGPNDKLSRLRPVVGNTVLRERLVGARTVDVSGRVESDVTVGWAIGSDPEKWSDSAPAFQEVSLGDVYEGVALHLRAHAGSVEKIFTVAPGADPGLIKYVVEGGLEAVVSEQGALVVETEFGPVSFSAPVAFQSVAGSTVDVEVAYKVENNLVAFSLGEYDKTLPLVIDPLLASTYVGGRQEDSVEDMVVQVESGGGLWDTDGSVYVTGYTASSDFPEGSTGFRGAGYDVFVSKFNRSLRSLEGTFFIGGNSNDVANAIVQDAAGNLFVAGWTESSDFPAAAYQGCYNATYNGGKDGFVAKLNENLVGMLACTFIGGGSNDVPADVEIRDAGQEIYITGYTESPDFPVSDAAYSKVFNGGVSDAFISRLNNDLVNLQYSTFLGGSGADRSYSICLDSTNVYVTGYTESTSATFPASGNGRWQENSGEADAFAAALPHSLGSRYAMTYLGGTDEDSAYAIAQGTDYLYITGYTYSGNFKTAAPYTPVHGGGADVFVASFSRDFSLMPRSIFIGGAGDEMAYDLKFTRVGALPPDYKYYVDLAGYSDSEDFPVSEAAFMTEKAGNEDGIIVRLKADDISVTNMMASTYVGGFNDDRIKALHVFSSDSGWGIGATRVWVAGWTESEDFPVYDGAYDTAYNQNRDGFISRFAGELLYGSIKWRTEVQGNAGTPALDWNGNIYFGTDAGYIYSLNKYGYTNWVYYVGTANRSFEDPVTLSKKGVLYAVEKRGPELTANQGTKIYALNALTHNPSGEVLWTLYTNTTLAADAFSAPAVGLDGTSLYTTVFQAADGDTKLIAVSDLGHTNHVLWDVVLPDRVQASPVIGDDGTIYVAGLDVGPGTPNVMAFDPSDGSMIWSNYVAGSSRSSMALDTNGNLFVSTDSERTNVFALGSDGSLLWERGVWPASPGPTNACHAAPVVGTNDFVYFGSDDYWLYGYNIEDPADMNKWYTGGEVLGHPSIGSKGTVYAGIGYPGRLYAMKPGASNTFLWRTYLEWNTNGVSGTVIAADGTIYIGCGSNMVAVFSSEYMGKAPWPTFHHDVMRSGNVAFETAPFPPTGVAVTNAGFYDRMRITWNIVSNAAVYEVWKNPDGASSSNAVQIGTTASMGFDDFNVEPGKEYWYWVKARHSLGTSDFSDFAYGGMKPSPPTGLHASDNLDERIYVAWDRDEDEIVSWYMLYRSEEDDTNTATYVETLLSTNYTDEALTVGVAYYYWVKALNDYGESYFSISDEGGTPPLRPENITASDGVYDNKVLIEWDMAPGVRTYEVWSGRVASTSDASFLGMSYTNFYVDASTNVMPFVTNFYWLKSTNQFGISGFSDMASGWRDLPVPQNIRATDGEYPNKIKITWNTVADASSYKLLRNTLNNTNNLTLITHTFTNTYMDTSVVPGLRYYYWLQSVCDLGESRLSAMAVGGTPPLRPTDVNASDGLYPDKIAVSWRGAEGSSGYELWRGTVPELSGAKRIKSLSVTNYNDTAAKMGTLYYYWVKATNAFASGAFSSEDSGFKSILNPTGLRASTGSFTNRIEVSWDSVAGASEYELWRSDTNNINSAARLGFPSSPKYTDTEIVNGIVYYYWVKARNPVCVSEFSDVAEGYTMLGLADISVSDFVLLPAKAATGSVPEVVSMKIANHGIMDISIPNSKLEISIYLSTNVYLQEESDALVGSMTRDFSLRPNQSEYMVFTGIQRSLMTVPDVPPGDYYVLAYVNHPSDSKLFDPDLSDNVAVKTGKLTVMPGAVNAVYRALNDYSGDGKANLVVYDEAEGRWYIRGTSGDAVLWGEIFGGPGFIPVIGDFSGNKRADIAVYQEATGNWYARGVDGRVIMWAENWGGPGFTPVWGDYNGDGVTDLAVYHAGSGMWYARTVSGTLITWAENWGGPGFTPVWGDYNGDGVNDFAVYLEELWQWYVRSDSGEVLLWADEWGGQAGFIPVPGDYTGDGVEDLAVYHIESGYWFVKTLEGMTVKWGELWGGPGFTPVPGDYDGDGKSDLALYHDGTGAWFVKSSNGSVIFWNEIWGAPWMRPVGGVR